MLVTNTVDQPQVDAMSLDVEMREGTQKTIVLKTPAVLVWMAADLVRREKKTQKRLLQQEKSLKFGKDLNQKKVGRRLL